MTKPQIRFAGFADAWEQRKLSDITFSSGIKNRDNNFHESYSISNENGFVPQDEQFEHGGTMREADKSMYWIVSPKSFAYNPARINVGSIGYQNLDKNVIVSSLYEVFKTTADCDDSFLWYWMKSDLFRRLIEQYQEGGVRLYFFYDKFCKGSLLLPTVEEQTRIGQLFSNLDHLITLHQREYGKTVNIKRAMLEKMFPKDGADKPEIRFAGFTDAWEQRKLGELYQKRSEKNVNLQFSREDILSVAKMRPYESERIDASTDDYMKTYNVIRLNDIAFEGHTSNEFEYGRFVLNDYGNGIVSHVFDVYAPLQEFDSSFMKEYIHYEPIMKQILVRSTSSARMMNALKSNEFLQERLRLPSLGEQQRIGAFLDTISNLITLHQRELKKLQNIKKSLLEKMFA
jgi:type I restriction enzyme S subunit